MGEPESALHRRLSSWLQAHRERVVGLTLEVHAARAPRAFECARAQDLAQVAVVDDGLGICEGELHKLFKPLGRTSTCGTAGESSTGLGLAIASRIIEAHGGQLSVQSKKGVGSTFRFTLPLS
jgi:signal transduction histidine kinase